LNGFERLGGLGRFETQKQVWPALRGSVGRSGLTAVSRHQKRSIFSSQHQYHY